MGENTKIEWCYHTVNLWHGCAKVHTGCKNCYAETQAKRWGFDIWGVFLKNAVQNLRSSLFFKQIDKVRPIPPDLLIREKPF